MTRQEAWRIMEKASSRQRQSIIVIYADKVVTPAHHNSSMQKSCEFPFSRRTGVEPFSA
jgi:phosphoglycerol transferase MdoB-like AlkP superfamily enzyme